MKQLLVIHLMLLSTALVFSQEKVDTLMMQKIKDEEKNNSQISTIAHNITDVCGSRLTNSPGYNCALDWITKTLKEWGIINAGREAWGEFGKGWSNENCYVAMKVPYYQPIIAYPAAWTKGTAKMIKAQLIVIKNLDSASIDKLGDTLKGKIVLIKSTNPTIRSAFNTQATRYTDSALNKMHDDHMISRKEIEPFVPFLEKMYKTKLYLQSKGAVALVVSTGGSRDGTVFVDGSPGYAKGFEATLPELIVAREHYLMIQRLIADNKPVELEINVQNKFYTNDLTGYNVVGEIAGTDPNLKSQVVMLGGHLDS